MLWGFLILICTGLGTYLLAGSFIFIRWDMFNLNQVGALLLFLISFWSIFKLSEPQYHFIIYFEEQMLVIRTKKGQTETNILKLDVNDITKLQFAPHTPRKSNEAHFDFSSSFHLLFSTKQHPQLSRLIDVPGGSITLKVDDIADIMRFISNKNPDISIPDDQRAYFNL